MILRHLGKPLKHFILRCVVLCFWSPGLQAADPCRVVDGMFEDPGRDRVVPFRAYFPDPLEGRCPVVLFSHGLGGSRNAATYPGRHLAENGYAPFHIRIGPNYASDKDSRIRAGVVLSPPLPRPGMELKKAYQGIDIPLFCTTGTRDGSPLPSSRVMDPAQRTKPYQHINNNIPQFLMVLDKAGHMTFSGRRLGRPAEILNDPCRIDTVQRGILELFDAFRKKRGPWNGCAKTT